VLAEAMEVTAIEGNYGITCERVMHLMREIKDSMLAVLEAFVYDPLFDFRLNDARAFAPTCFAYRDGTASFVSHGQLVRHV